MGRTRLRCVARPCRLLLESPFHFFLTSTPSTADSHLHMQVLDLYRRTASSVLGTVASLNYLGLAIEQHDEWCRPSRLAETLNYCSRLESLNICGARLNDAGIAELMNGLATNALPELKLLEMHQNRFSAVGVRAVCDAFGRGVSAKLQVLGMSCCLFGNDGAAAFATALHTNDVPASLAMIDLNLNDIGNAGAVALAVALHGTKAPCRIFCANNAVGLTGQAALMRALEARHGITLVHAVAVMVLNPPFYPAYLTRATARGMRLYVESGRLA